MLALSLFTLSCAAAASMALPATTLAPSCSGLGGGAFDKQTNFTLAAWNATGTNANSTGVPLVLGQAGAIDGAEFKVLSTFASYPYNQYPWIELDSGRLIAHGETEDTVLAGDRLVPAGEELSFIVSKANDPHKGPQAYCAVADTDPAGGGTGHPFLAVNNDTDSFALCQVSSQNNIVYKPSANNSEYNISSCYPVRVQLIF